MKKITLIVLLISVSQFIQGQNTIDWSKDYMLELADFQSPASEIGAHISSLQSSATIGFSIRMSNLEFMSTKNFNSKINTTFTRDAASIIAPDETVANQLLNFARYGFDLAELHARKFRKRIFEEKKATSDLSLFEEIFREIDAEYSRRHAEMAKKTEMGMKGEELIIAHQLVIKEIEELSDFCKTCKPPKKKRKKKKSSD